MMPFDYWWNLIKQTSENDAGPCPPAPSLTAQHVFREHAGRVYNLARRMLNNDADAEDVTQDVLLQVVRKLDTFRGEAEVTTWLHRITVNAVLLQRRTNRRRAECRPTGHPESLDVNSVHLPASCASLAPDRQAMGREARRLIEDAVSRLPAPYRSVFMLSDIEGYNNARICTALGLSLPAVKSRLHRARVFLRQMLSPHFAEARA
jgi:RNA polymerase sigma-70 factor, ECF subfamily